jgi:soluble lytic murein transglycosylase-like protein
MMVPSEIRQGLKVALARINKSVYICFILALLMLAASPMRAADVDSRPLELQNADVHKAESQTAEVHKIVVRADAHTGKLVRYTIVIHPAAPAAPSASISQLVEKTAKAHAVDPLLVDSVIQVESNYDPHAVSPKGAQGLMQLMPPTAQMLGVNDSFDPAENIEAGVKYLKYLQDLYKDDRLALAAYNAGPAAVDRFKKVPPYPETQKYVEKVGKKYGEARNARDRKAAASRAQAMAQVTTALPPLQAQPEQEQHPKLEQFVDSDGRLHLRTSQ